MSYLTDRTIDVAGLTQAVESAETGGIAVFIGTVRNHQGGRAVCRLEYSAYPSMAEAECDRIVAEAETRWPAQVRLAHRVGPLSVGEVAVAVVAGAAHRDPAFAACRHVIEEVKRRVPIWKKEFYADGSTEWVDPTSRMGNPGPVAVVSG